MTTAQEKFAEHIMDHLDDLHGEPERQMQYILGEILSGEREDYDVDQLIKRGKEIMRAEGLAYA